MATFTIRLREIISSTGGTIEIAEDGVSRLTGGKIGVEYLSLPDGVSGYAPILTGKIVDRFLMREIGYETVEQFQWGMRRKLNEIMPFYGQMYLSEQIAFDPLATIDLSTITNNTGSQTAAAESNSDSSSNNTSKSRAVNNDFPQTSLAGNGDYATTAADSASEADGSGLAHEESESSSESVTDGTSSTKGFQGVASELLMRYRDSILNIDVMVLNELEDQFMGIWDNGDRYTNERY